LWDFWPAPRNPQNANALPEASCISPGKFAPRLAPRARARGEEPVCPPPPPCSGESLSGTWGSVCPPALGFWGGCGLSCALWRSLGRGARVQVCLGRGWGSSRAVSPPGEVTFGSFSPFFPPTASVRPHALCRASVSRCPSSAPACGSVGRAVPRVPQPGASSHWGGDTEPPVWCS